MTITKEEREQLIQAEEALMAMLKLVQGAKNLNVSESVVDLSKLVPSGGLKDLKERMKSRMPITEEEFDSLVNDMKIDIKQNSRLNGILQNVTIVGKGLAQFILPIFGA